MPATRSAVPAIVAVVAASVLVAGIVVVMLVSDEASRTQVWTSLIATGVLVACWPLVRRSLTRRRA